MSRRTVEELAADLGRRRLAFEGLVNFRDLGGYETSSGRRTRWGRVFRSDALYRLTRSDMEQFGILGVRTVYDLRNDEERRRSPNPMASTPLALESGVARGEFADGSSLRERADAEKRLRDVYLAILATAPHLFGQLFSDLSDPEVLPAVIHCAGGKDRTGLAAALLLSVLGVDRETVLDDYELTNYSQTAERHQEILQRFMETGMTAEGAAGLLGAPRWAMAEALSELDERYGGIDGYLHGAAGLEETTFEALRTLLTE
jgi:protein-tyrosine phosphatase